VDIQLSFPAVKRRSNNPGPFVLLCTVCAPALRASCSAGCLPPRDAVSTWRSLSFRPAPAASECSHDCDIIPVAAAARDIIADAAATNSLVVSLCSTLPHGSVSARCGSNARSHPARVAVRSVHHQSQSGLTVADALPPLRCAHSNSRRRAGDELVRRSVQVRRRTPRRHLRACAREFSVSVGPCVSMDQGGAGYPSLCVTLAVPIRRSLRVRRPLLTSRAVPTCARVRRCPMRSEASFLRERAPPQPSSRGFP